MELFQDWLWEILDVYKRQEQHADLIRDYCREFFVSKGMIADFAIHDKGDGNPHAHIMLTMRAVDENGKWLPKSRKVYDLDEKGERIWLPSGRWKSHKTVSYTHLDVYKRQLPPSMPLPRAMLRLPISSTAKDLYKRQSLESSGGAAGKEPFAYEITP